MKTEHSIECEKCKMYNWENNICPDCRIKNVIKRVEAILEREMGLDSEVDDVLDRILDKVKELEEKNDPKN